MARIGIQLMMLKEHVAEQGLLPVLERVHEIGFEVVEVSPIPLAEENLLALVTARDRFGIEVAAISATTSLAAGAPGPTLADDLALHVEQARRLGTRMIRIGMMPTSAMRSREAFDAFVLEVDGYARELAGEGISLSYHNHHIEFARLDGITLLDRLRAGAPHLRYEIDCHWVQRGGRDPVRTLAEFAGVLDLVHLKDHRIALPSAEILDARDAGHRETWDRYWGGDIVQFAEVGEGTLDWRAVIEQAVASGAHHLLIEQDRTYGRDIWESLVSSRAHLVSLGHEGMITTGGRR